MSELTSLLFGSTPIIDVRTPAEFEKGHVPGALNLPLFTNKERHEVGLLYKQKGQSAAIEQGLDFVGPKMSDLVRKAQKLVPNRKAVVYCWRGGMRSGSVAWLLNTAGFETEVFPGGYKTWRKEVMKSFQLPAKLINLAGFTGVGKTEILHELQAKGEQVIDLEGLAHHMGSSFGKQSSEQPTTEAFENKLAAQLYQFDLNKPIWIEDESRSIGYVFLDHVFYQKLVDSPMVLINRPKEDRVSYLCELYGEKDIERLRSAFERLRKRMGGQNVNVALEYLNEGNLAAAARIALQYYDKAYLHGMSKLNRKPTYSLSLKDITYGTAAEQLIEWKEKTHLNALVSQA